MNKYWGEHSTNFEPMKTVYDKYNIPNNCETLVTPLLNKEIVKINSLTPYNCRIDTELVQI